MIKNPVIRGFNPDPSALVFKDKVYVAVSTFQWVPGVAIYETSDLVNYEIVSTPLKHLDLRGNPVDTSLWAPQLSYVDNLFYLLYTEVKTTTRPFKDLHNYVVTATDIKGPWSDPIYLNSTGFDPSFYHDNDMSYLVQETWDYRIKEDNKFAGITIQAFNRKTQKLMGIPKVIFKGTDAKKTEGPHLYFIDNIYYLITAEGGTKEGHQVTVARSKDLMGPYEVDPNNPMLSARDHPSWPLQCAGHASLIYFKDQYYIYYLVTRGYPSILGRETALQKVHFIDGWPRLETGYLPLEDLNIAGDQIHHPYTQDFSKKLDHSWLFLRKFPTNKWFKRSAQGIHLYGGDSLTSLFDVSLIARRIDEVNFDAKLHMSYEPKHFNELSGVGFYLDETKHLFFYVTHHETKGIVARAYYKNGASYEVYDQMIELDQTKHLIEINVKGGKAVFTIDGIPYPITFDLSFLIYNFTGTALVMGTVDLNQRYTTHAIFHDFSYQSYPE